MRVENKRTYRGPGVYIGRPSKWGNPYTHMPTKTLAETRVPTREDAIRLYEDYARGNMRHNPTWLDELRGAPALICWCAPLPCHGDVLVRLIEELDNQPALR